jgi:hypothetical protein
LEEDGRAGFFGVEFGKVLLSYGFAICLLNDIKLKQIHSNSYPERPSMASSDVDLAILRPTAASGHRGLGMVKEEDSISEKKIKFPLTQGELAAVFGILVGFGVAMLGIYVTMPDVDYQLLKLPHNVEELRSLT